MTTIIIIITSIIFTITLILIAINEYEDEEEEEYKFYLFILEITMFIFFVIGILIKWYILYILVGSVMFIISTCHFKYFFEYINNCEICNILNDINYKIKHYTIKNTCRKCRKKYEINHGLDIKYTIHKIKAEYKEKEFEIDEKIKIYDEVHNKL